jgi:phosphonopyruvate decarboxylase
MGIAPDSLTYMAVGAMGLDTSQALGFALALPERRVVALQGDGSLMMNVGSMATIADQAPHNLVHIICRNQIYEANGGQPIPKGTEIDYPGLARSCGYRQVFYFQTLDDWRAGLGDALAAHGPTFICIDVTAGAAPKLDYEKLHAPDLIEQFRKKLAATEYHQGRKA